MDVSYEMRVGWMSDVKYAPIDISQNSDSPEKYHQMEVGR